MVYQIKLTKTVAEVVRKFHPDIKKLTKSALKEIADNPYLCKELQEDLEGYLSSKFKRYRIVYAVDDETKTVIVHMVWHRRNVYELLAQLIPGAE